MSGYLILTLNENKDRHDKIDYYIHWQIYQYCSTARIEKYYEHHSEPGIESHDIIGITPPSLPTATYRNDQW